MTIILQLYPGLLSRQQRYGSPLYLQVAPSSNDPPHKCSFFLRLGCNSDRIVDLVDMSVRLLHFSHIESSIVVSAKNIRRAIRYLIHTTSIVRSSFERPLGLCLAHKTAGTCVRYIHVEWQYMHSLGIQLAHSIDSEGRSIWLLGGRDWEDQRVVADGVNAGEVGDEASID